MKFAKAYSSVSHARRKVQRVTPDLCHWTERDGMEITMHTGDDKYAIVQLSNRDLDNLIARLREMRIKAAEYRAQGSDPSLTMFGFDLHDEPLKPMD